MPSLNNAYIRVDFDFTNGISLTRILDAVTGRDYLPAPSPLFKFAINNGKAFTSDKGFSVELDQKPGISAFTAVAHSIEQKMCFHSLQTC